MLDNIKALIDGGGFREVLLHGVTGSGKQRFTCSLYSTCWTRGREAIVLVPEISLTPQMVDRFRGRFGGRVAVMHSSCRPAKDTTSGGLSGTGA